MKRMIYNQMNFLLIQNELFIGNVLIIINGQIVLIIEHITILVAQYVNVMSKYLYQLDYLHYVLIGIIKRMLYYLLIQFRLGIENVFIGNVHNVNNLSHVLFHKWLQHILIVDY